MARLTRQQVREVDRRAFEVYGVPSIVLMENAARGAADAADEMLRHTKGRPAVILCGGGNNGGDGLAVARHLSNRGHPVQIVLCTRPQDFKGDALTNWRIVQASGLPWRGYRPEFERFEGAGLIIDAVFGTGLTAEPRSPFGSIAGAVEHSGAPVLAVDLPSGLDCDTGLPLGPSCIKAERTVTFVAPKAGFANPESLRYTGEVSVADIGCPRRIIDEVLATA